MPPQPYQQLVLPAVCVGVAVCVVVLVFGAVAVAVFVSVWFAVSVLAMTGALGAGGVVLFLWIADFAPWSWRIFYLMPLPFLFALRPLARRLPETKRYEVYELKEVAAHDPDAAIAGVTDLPAAAAAPHRSERAARFAMLGAFSLTFNVFLAPAGGFQNNFLLNEQHFPGWQITVFQVLTTVPPGIMLVVGGRLADEYGRRKIGTIGIVGGTIFTVLMYLSTGWPIWLYSTLSVLAMTGALGAGGVV
ncbi:MAG: hypothetical protein ACXVFD_16425, partial [Gaiellaceae bacterium]